MSFVRKLADWFDHRTGYRGLLHAALLEPIPGGARWRYVWGSTLTVCFVTQIVTGLFLWMGYSPSSQTAWESVYYIQHQTTAGWLLRGIHHFTAHAMVYLLVIHFVQVVIDGAYRAPRELNFIVGLMMAKLVLAMALTGYLLPWDQKGYWATSVGTNLASQAPVVGPALKKLIVGGSDYGHHTLTRFFALHAGVLPGLFAVLLAAHIWLFRRHGITAHKPEGKPAATFWPEQVLKDSVAALAVLAGVLALTIYRGGAELGAPADPANPYDAARPEGYFLFLFQLLKWFPGEMEVWGAFVIPGVAGLLLVAMPWIGRTRAGHVFNVGLLVVLLGGAALLTVQAFHDDYYARWHKKPEKPSPAQAEKFEASEKFLAANEEAEFQARRIRLLAGAADRIPPSGALSLAYDDPFLQGPRLFKQHCASCHNHAMPAWVKQGAHAKAAAVFSEHAEIAASAPRAPNLFGVGGPIWASAWLDAGVVASDDYLGYQDSPFAEGDMASFVRDSWPADGLHEMKSEALAAPAVIRAALVAESGVAHRGVPPADWQKSVEAGRILLTGKLADVLDSGTSCVDCHKFHEHGELGMAPDLTGYMSREWMIDFIKNPAAERFYGDRNDRMPAFAPHDEERLNQLDQKSIELIVDWLRGEWQRGEAQENSQPPAPQAAP